jgi:hypothetical protein
VHRLNDSQNFDRSNLCADSEPERRLLREMLLDAIECWQSVSAGGLMSEDCVTGSRDRLYREAHIWIFGEYDNSPFFSFAQVCECLGLDPDFIRRGLSDWRRSLGKD